MNTVYIPVTNAKGQEREFQIEIMSDFNEGPPILELRYARVSDGEVVMELYCGDTMELRNFGRALLAAAREIEAAQA